jgi:hypothetical protein
MLAESSRCALAMGRWQSFGKTGAGPKCRTTRKCYTWPRGSSRLSGKLASLSSPPSVVSRLAVPCWFSSRLSAGGRSARPAVWCCRWWTTLDNEDLTSDCWDLATTQTEQWDS